MGGLCSRCFPWLSQAARQGFTRLDSAEPATTLDEILYISRSPPQPAPDQVDSIPPFDLQSASVKQEAERFLQDIEKFKATLYADLREHEGDEGRGPTACFELYSKLGDYYGGAHASSAASSSAAGSCSCVLM